MMRILIHLHVSKAPSTASKAFLAFIRSSFEGKQSRAAHDIFAKDDRARAQEGPIQFHGSISDWPDIPQELLDNIVQKMSFQTKRRSRLLSRKMRNTVDTVHAREVNDWIFPFLFDNLRTLKLKGSQILRRIAEFVVERNHFGSLLIDALVVDGAGGAHLNIGNLTEEKVHFVEEILLSSYVTTGLS